LAECPRQGTVRTDPDGPRPLVVENLLDILEGELTIWVDGETHVAPAGSFVLGPRDIPHTFKNVGDVKY
jgi:mannose-6-phosphate isomerase-like protein (cupin superfamily)